MSFKINIECDLGTNQEGIKRGVRNCKLIEFQRLFWGNLLKNLKIS